MVATSFRNNKMKTSDKKSVEQKAINNGLERYREEENGQEKSRLELESVISDFEEKLRDVFRERLAEILKDYRYGNDQKIGDKILNYLEAHKMLYPRISVLLGSEADKAIKEYDFYHEPIQNTEALIVFRLPKQLDNFWWKSSRLTNEAIRTDEQASISNNAQLNGQVIEWGTIYDQIMPTVWNIRNSFIDESKIDFERLNEFGQHDVDNYYYLWVVRIPSHK